MELRQIVVTLEKEKETKNMVRYKAPGADEDIQRTATMPTLYVRKTALATSFGGFPASIKVTVELP